MRADRGRPDGDPANGDDAYEVDRKVQHALDRLTLLINAAEALASTLDEETGLRRLCRTLLPGLADWCAVDLADRRGRLRRIVVEHRDADRLSPGLYEGFLPPTEGSAAATARALQGAGPILLTEFLPPHRAADPLHARELELFDHMTADTAVIAPLRARRQVLGVLTLVRTTREARLDEDVLSSSRTSPTGSPWPSTTRVCTSRPSTQPNACSVRSCPICRPTAPWSSPPDTGRPLRRPRSAGTGTTRSCCPKAPPR